MERWGCVVKLREQPPHQPVAPQILQQLPELQASAQDLLRSSGTQLHASQQMTNAGHQIPQHLARNETSRQALHAQPPQSEPGGTHSPQGLAHPLFPGPSPPSIGYTVATATGMLNPYVQSLSSPHDRLLSFTVQDRVPDSQFQSQQQQQQQQPHQQHGPLQNPHLQHLVHPYQNLQYQSPSIYHPPPSTPPGRTGFQLLNNLSQSSSFADFSTASSLLDDNDQPPPPRKPIAYKPRTPEDKAGRDNVDDLLNFLPPLKKPTPGHPPGPITPKKTPVKRLAPKKKASTAKVVFIGDDDDPFEEEAKEKTKAKSAALKTSTALEKKKPGVPPSDDAEDRTTEQPPKAKAKAAAKKAGTPLEKKRKRTPSQSPIQLEEGTERDKNEQDASVKKPDAPRKSTQKPAEKTAEKTAAELQAAAERRKAGVEKRKETLEKKKAAQELLKNMAEAVKMPPPPEETPEEKTQRQHHHIEEMMLAALEDDDFLQLCEVVSTMWQRVGLAGVGQGLFSSGGTGTGN
jgi:hypothetical protein